MINNMDIIGVVETWMKESEDSFGCVNKLRTKTENKGRCSRGLNIVFGETLQNRIKLILKWQMSYGYHCTPMQGERKYTRSVRVRRKDPAMGNLTFMRNSRKKLPKLGIQWEM
jgi:hypothetical protein